MSPVDFRVKGPILGWHSETQSSLRLVLLCEGSVKCSQEWKLSACRIALICRLTVDTVGTSQKNA